MTVQEALAKGTASLRATEIPAPERDARLLMALALKVDPSRITLMAQDDISRDDYLSFKYLIDQRREHMPISHILGFREFYGRRFKVTGDVLDPRPDTETLVEIALQRPFAEVLDLGTGSGCIVITLLAENAAAIGIGCDLSEDALAIAEENATELGVAPRLGLMPANWFHGVGGTYDLIVSNPPYIALHEIEGLSWEVRDHEPRMALTDHADGLTAYRAIAADVLQFLTPGGRLLLEIGPTQAQAVTDLLTQKGLVNVTTHPDLDGRDRVISAYSHSLA